MIVVKTFLLNAALLTIAVTTRADTLIVRKTDPLSPEQERSALMVPDGFEIQLFASEPMINKPINMAFDSQGRLWVSSTTEYPYAAKKERWVDAKGSRVRDSRDAIKILEDSDGDGRADKVTDFADGLNIPTGVLPWKKLQHYDGCIAWSIPNIWYFADTTGDGRCDHREVLFGPLGFEKDTHGMCSSFRMGSDGWVYATHGFNNTSHFEAKDGSTLDLNSGNVFRFRPDGSNIEIWSRGQVNPFGLCFDRRGNLYSADCHSAPIYQLLRGAVYPSFGKPHDGLGFGPTMLEHTHGSTGICGLVYIDDGRWGKKWNDRMFVGNVVTSRVNADRIEFDGSSPRAVEEPDLVTSEDPWFRPVDLQLGPDGALYIADFYNRIIGHYEVPLDHPGRDRERGRIWRVVKKNRQDWKLPAADPIPASIPILYDLTSDSPFEQRRTAAWVQEHPSVEAVPFLVLMLEETGEDDTHLRHVVRMALRECLKLPKAFQQLSGPVQKSIVEIVLAVPSQEAANYLMRYLDQGLNLPAKEKFPILSHIARSGAVDRVHSLIETERLHSPDDVLLQSQVLNAFHVGLSSRGDNALNSTVFEWGQQLVTGLLMEKQNGDGIQWNSLPYSEQVTLDRLWNLQLRKCSDGNETMILSSLRKGESGAEQRRGILQSQSFSAPEKLSFWICGHRGFPDKPPHNLNRVRLILAKTGEELFNAYPPRSDVCRKIEWEMGKYQDKKVKLEIIDGDSGKAFAWVGITRIKPARISIESFPRSQTYSIALRNLAALLQHTAPADLRERLSMWMPPRPAAPPAPISAEERTRLDGIIKQRIDAFHKTEPNQNKGKQIFLTHCIACHQIGGEGGLVGPQLDGIGTRGVARLCEDILDPNRNVDAHFYLTAITMKDDSSAAGFLKKIDGNTIILIDSAGKEHRLPKLQIAETKTISNSLMPPVFHQTIPEKDFIDLVAWLMEGK